MIFFIYFLIIIFYNSCYANKDEIGIKIFLSSVSKHKTIALSSYAVELLKNKKLNSYYENQIVLFKKNIGLFPTFVQKEKLRNLIDTSDLIKKIEPIAFWHFLIPTVGLTNKPLTYPFLPHAFSLHELAPRRGKGITIGLLDHIVHQKKNTSIHYIKKKSKIESYTFNPFTSYSKSHAVHSMGTIISNFGIAPDAKIIMINIFDDKGKSWPSLLIEGLREAILMNVDIVNISAKLTDYLDPLSDLSCALEIYLNIIPYVVAASGNSNHFQSNNTLKHTMSIESYPARFDSIPFDVGSFGYEIETNTYPVSQFSQYEKTIGPKFLVPGENILSHGIIDQHEEEEIYLLMNGTSMAAPIMSGFVALMLSEFQTDFSREELLSACYSSTIHLHDSNDWQVKTLLGTIDMRTVLFSLHCIRYLKKEIIFKNYSFKKLLELVHNILFEKVDVYGKKYFPKISFKNSFIDYVEASQKINFNIPDYFYNLNDALNYIKKEICLRIKNYCVPFKKKLLPERIERSFMVSRQSASLFVNNPSSYFDNEIINKNKNFIKNTQHLREYWKRQINWVSK